MKKKLSPTIVGAFVAGALVLAVAALVSFGSGRLFNKPARFVVMVRQTSISGLEPGAPVKFSGVRVGRVQEVHAQMDREGDEVVVRVDCTINEEAAAAMFPPPVPPREEMIPRLVEAGMSAKLNFSGITGLLYLDLIINPERRGQGADIDPQTGAVVVPAESSVLEELTATLTTIASNFARIDFVGLSTDLRTLVRDVDSVLKDADVRGTLARISAAADSVGELAQNGDLRAALEELNRSMTSLNGLITELRGEVPGLRTNLQETLTEASEAMRAVGAAALEAQELLGARGGLGGELAVTLDALRDAARSAEQLIEYIERNPSALLRGRADDEATGGGSTR